MRAFAQFMEGEPGQLLVVAEALQAVVIDLERRRGIFGTLLLLRIEAVEQRGKILFFSCEPGRMIFRLQTPIVLAAGQMQLFRVRLYQAYGRLEDCWLQFVLVQVIRRE